MTIRERLTQIAQTTLSIDTLDTRGRDLLDFHEMHVHALEAALLEAYAAGYQARKEHEAQRQKAKKGGPR